ncbi:hypothetical protein KHA80_11945 [Anaerobacillus sp. HL2]|nr:hypothetical protein KHA80_11945 [Anaerobacillus sp. HL2]
MAVAAAIVAPTPAPGAVDASDSATSQTKTNADGSKTVVSTVDVNKLTQSLQNAISK